MHKLGNNILCLAYGTYQRQLLQWWSILHWVIIILQGSFIDHEEVFMVYILDRGILKENASETTISLYELNGKSSLILFCLKHLFVNGKEITHVVQFKFITEELTPPRGTI